jgi:phage terminase large subunit
VDYKRYGFSDVIAKPFEISRLSKVLHEALN